MNKTPYGNISRRECVTLGQAIEKLLGGTGISEGLMADDVCRAWDRICGLPQGTAERRYSGGNLYVTFSSSALRTMMYPHKESLMARLNSYLAANPRFADIDTPVRNIVFR
ncbi:MAG: DUF721 domain-containing protein [Bacteroidales bacterium]|nr:DUF721 domain-containing protein [Bacteroidales bacterium]